MMINPHFLVKIFFILSLLSFLLWWQRLWESPQNFPEGNDYELYIVDVSKSMQVRDIWELSRLEFAQNLIKEHISQTTSQIGLHIFAGNSQRILPFSSERDLFLTFLLWLDSDLLSEPGSNISGAISDALEAFWTEKSGKIFLLTDGGDDAISLAPSLQERLIAQNIQVYVIGIWSLAGGELVEGYDLFWVPQKKVYQGKNVVLRLNEEELKNLSYKLSGSYERNAFPKLWNTMHSHSVFSLGEYWLFFVSFLCLCSSILFFYIPVYVKK